MRASLITTFALAGGVIILILWAVRTKTIIVSSSSVSIWQTVFLVLVGVTIAISLIRKIHSRVFWEGIFSLTVFLGVWFAFLLILPLWWALGIAAVLLLGEIFLRMVWIHDLLYLLGCAGVALNFANWLPAEVLIAGLVVLTVYDMVAGPPGGPIEALAAHLVRTGVVPGLVIPGRIRQLSDTLERVTHEDAALLGAGDLIVPLTLVASAGFRGIRSAVIVLAGLLLGAIVLGWRQATHPRAALPFLAVGAVVPYLILLALPLVWP